MSLPMKTITKLLLLTDSRNNKTNRNCNNVNKDFNDNNYSSNSSNNSESYLFNFQKVNL